MWLEQPRQLVRACLLPIQAHAPNARSEVSCPFDIRPRVVARGARKQQPLENPGAAANMREAQAGETPDSYRSASQHHQPPLTPAAAAAAAVRGAASARYTADVDHQRPANPPSSRSASPNTVANGTPSNMKPAEVPSWNTKNLGSRVGADCAAAASAGALVAPVVTAIDR